MNLLNKFNIYTGGVEIFTIILSLMSAVIGVYVYSSSGDIYKAAGWMLAWWSFLGHIVYQRTIFKLRDDSYMDMIYMYALERYSNISELYEKNPLHKTELADSFNPESFHSFKDLNKHIDEDISE
jgi:hypothetical protein